MKAKVLGVVFALVSVIVSPATARADVVLDWNAIALTALGSQNPFNQARLLSIVQLSVFEAVNAITGEFRPYLSTVVAPPGASAEAAAIAAAHMTLKQYAPATQAAMLDAKRAEFLAAIPDGQAKEDGIDVGEAAAAAMILLRAADGSAPPGFYNPSPWPTGPGVWQKTATCSPSGGAFYNWPGVAPFGVPSAHDFMLGPPPALDSTRYAKDYAEVMRVGSINSDEIDRPADRANVAKFYASVSPGGVASSIARQLAAARGDSLSQNARALALIPMAINDALVTSFMTKYHYGLWRPETAIPAGDTDGNDRTVRDLTFKPYVNTPCFPSYPSNHASGTNAGLEVLRRLYGAGGHHLTLVNTNLGMELHYSELKQISDDVDDARVYGGIHFRFDQEEGGRLGREVATYVVKHNLVRHGHPE